MKLALNVPGSEIMPNRSEENRSTHTHEKKGVGPL